MGVAVLAMLGAIGSTSVAVPSAPIAAVPILRALRLGARWRPVNVYLQPCPWVVGP
jgi:hypothetical protein